MSKDEKNKETEETKDVQQDTQQEETKEDKTKDEGKTFTQSEVNAMMAKEKRQGRRSLLKELGFKDEEEFKESLSVLKPKDKKEEKNDPKEDKSKMEAEERALIAEAKVEAMVRGAKPDCIEDIIILARGKAKDDDYKSVLDEVKMKHPHMFKAETSNDDKTKNDDESKDESKEAKSENTKAEERKEDEDRKKKDGTGSSLKSSKTAVGEEKRLGARLAQKRKTSTAKKSFWD